MGPWGEAKSKIGLFRSGRGGKGEPSLSDQGWLATPNAIETRCGGV